jgi:hypothetical protein
MYELIDFLESSLKSIILLNEIEIIIDFLPIDYHLLKILSNNAKSLKIEF